MEEALEVHLVRLAVDLPVQVIAVAIRDRAVDRAVGSAMAGSLHPERTGLRLPGLHREIVDVRRRLVEIDHVVAGLQVLTEIPRVLLALAQHRGDAHILGVDERYAKVPAIDVVRLVEPAQLVPVDLGAKVEALED